MRGCVLIDSRTRRMDGIRYQNYIHMSVIRWWQTQCVSELFSFRFARVAVRIVRNGIRFDVRCVQAGSNRDRRLSKNAERNLNDVIYCYVVSATFPGSSNVSRASQFHFRTRRPHLVRETVENRSPGATFLFGSPFLPSTLSSHRELFCCIAIDSFA